MYRPRDSFYIFGYSEHRQPCIPVPLTCTPATRWGAECLHLLDPRRGGVSAVATPAHYWVWVEWWGPPRLAPVRVWEKIKSSEKKSSAGSLQPVRFLFGGGPVFTLRAAAGMAHPGVTPLPVQGWGSTPRKPLTFVIAPAGKSASPSKTGSQGVSPPLGEVGSNLLADVVTAPTPTRNMLVLG